MTTNSNTKVTTTITEMRNAIVNECGIQIAQAAEAARAVPLDPRWTYRPRLLQAVASVSPDCSEHMLYSAWRGDRTLEQLAETLHHALCEVRLGRLAEGINSWAAEENDKEAAHRARLTRRNDNI